MNSSCLLYTPNSGNSYYFRSRIPRDLSNHFGGLREFRVSLKCAIKSHANRITKILNQIVSEIYEEIRQGMKSLEIEDIKEILRIEIRKQILHVHHVDLGTNKYDEMKKEMSLESIEQRETLFQNTLRNELRTYHQELDVKLEGIFESLNLQFEKDSVPYKTLRKHFVDLYLLRHGWMRELVDETGKTDDDFRRDAELKLGLELFPDLSKHSESMPKESIHKQTPELVSTDSDAEETLSDSSTRFFERKRLEKKSPKSIQEDESVIAEFIEIIGDIDTSLLTKKEVNCYIDIQSKLPPNRKKSPKYRESSISELVGMNLPEKETQTTKNINKRITKLSTFANWGVRQGLLQTNPFRDMKLSVRNIATQRRMPFSAQELRKILKPETYLNWTINFKHKIYQKGGGKNQVPYYWVFILGILSGMRTNEMCQLRLSDLKKEKRIWFIHVEGSEDTKVKTLTSIRKIPVHPILIDLGFIDYVGNLKRKKKDRIFWELRQSRDGYAKEVSRHFNEKFLPAVGVWEKNVKVLYSTRHTFINCLYRKNVDENIIKSLVGHEKEFTMKHYGGDPFTPERLLKEISKVSYSGIKWKSLKVV